MLFQLFRKLYKGNRAVNPFDFLCTSIYIVPFLSLFIHPPPPPGSTLQLVRHLQPRHKRARLVNYVGCMNRRLAQHV